MASATPRRRASTLKASDSDVSELRGHFEVLRQPILTSDRSRVEGRLLAKLRAGHGVRQSLLDDNNARHSKDAFRHLDGFQIILAALDDLLTSAQEKDESFLDVLHTLLGVISAALRDHKGNERYFKQRIDGGGWTSLQQSLDRYLISQGCREASDPTSIPDRVFGCLLSCVLNDESVISLYSNLRRRLKKRPTTVEEKDAEAGSQSEEKDLPVQVSQHVATILETELNSNATVCHPEAILVMLGLWTKVMYTKAHADVFSPAVTFGTISIMTWLAVASTSNLTALHDVGALGSILPYLLENPWPDSSIDAELHALATELLHLGIGTLDDAYFMYRNAKSSPLIADLLATSLKTSRGPSFVHLDLSLHGYASIELPGIGRSFPPVGSSPGYTLSLWLQVVRFDPHAHTTIFGAFDATQTCFVLVYMEKDTRNLILQTSVTSSRPSVRFKQATFEEGRWYHVVIAHQRPKPASSSRASLFLDGEFVEQVKSLYPTTSPAANTRPEVNGSPASRAQGNNAIQAFLGTPQDLATRLGKGVVLSQWRVASSHLFSTVLSDDLITVYYQLGPRYAGNFQDCLGSFQTYEASAALNLRNESLHPGTEDRSEIVAAIRSKAGLLLPESVVLLNLSASVVLDDNDQNHIDETQLLKSLSKTASKNLRNVTRAGCNALAINGAIPSINDALLHSSGFAVLTGDPTVVVPQSLDEAAWRIGGCASVGLALLDASHHVGDLVHALNIVFESVRENWRNSEAMERENGFGVLATILTSKLDEHDFRRVDSPNPQNASSVDQGTPHAVHLQILRSILNFVGYNSDEMEDSVINNPLAYRILLVDMEFWRRCSTEVQKLYYEQFIAFASRSKYQYFNMRRLLRMRIVKKWIENLKTGSFTEEIFENFLQAFKIMLGRNVSADSMRSLSLYITYAVHKPSAREVQPARSKSLKLNTSLSMRRKTLSSVSPNSKSMPAPAAAEMTHMQVALRLLETYVVILCQEGDTANIQKFARTVTNKWLLHLIADDEAKVVVMGMKILARLLVISGPAYMSKFVEKTGGVSVMQHRLKRWWDVPAIWTICFAIFFGVDLAKIDFGRSFDLFNLLDLFVTGDQATVVYPEIFPVLTTMLQDGLKSVAREQSDPDSPMTSPRVKDAATFSTQKQTAIAPKMNIVPRAISQSADERLIAAATLLRTVTRFLADLHTRSQSFRDFASMSVYVQEMFAVLFPIVVSSNAISPETELHARDSALTFHGNDVIMRPLSANAMASAPVVRTSNVSETQNTKPRRHQAPRRMSSYVLVSSEGPRNRLSSLPNLETIVSPSKVKKTFNLSSTIVQELLEVTIAVFEDQIFSRKDFPGLGLFMRVPPGFQEHQAYFETFILRNTLSQLGNHIKLNQKLLWEPRVLTNLARLATHLSEGIYEGWFIDGAEDSLDFLAQILEYLQLPDVAAIKNVRLCSQIIANIRTVLLRIILLRLSELDEASSADATTAFLNKLAYWQTILQPTDDSQVEQFRLLCYLLYSRLTCENREISMAAANLWRMLIVQKPEEISDILIQGGTTTSAALIRGFKKIMEIDNEAFLDWIGGNEHQLDDLLFHPISRSWDAFVAVENHRTVETARARITKRREKLRMWESINMKKDEILRRHESSTDHWRSNIYAAEDLKRHRALQDQQDAQVFNVSTWERMRHALKRPCGLFEEAVATTWQLDQTEGRNRMRMRMIPDKKSHPNDFQPKRRQSQGPSKPRRSNTLRAKASVKSLSQLATPQTMVPLGSSSPASVTPSSAIEKSNVSGGDAQEEDVSDEEDDFEMIDGPVDEPEEYEDKNRKVMRSLQRGDQVDQVHNVARIVGLEAIESLLILGKSFLYLLDSLFQRSDGEVVNAWQAPQEERDPYLQMITGREADTRPAASMKTDYETRSWRWEDVLSISKRRFLFREVAIELFFVDGRSYLLTTKTAFLRNELFQRLLTMATNVTDRTATASEDSWRIESVRNPADETQTFGSKFTSVFASATANPATRRWIKGEISNYHYLMLINTMAGRTFNDLTQYPVFPWVIADYTSEELDLSNPRSYRDLSKPMGCQTAEREAEFRDRYKSFAEMGDQNAPPFHYGTHYSSAMIVTSYLIRLQPFVQSYLLLQGESFDHPDRLFYSMEKAWVSASRDNMTDVRELIPEFFYLPDFLTNINGYDFGTRQGDGGAIDTVTLPPWAKGDPKIFIAKNREALESEYVSQHLHRWIDLIFGHKQRGDNALEATNVFHHLSYHGSKNLDTIEDPVERLATIGIIHNFGQTPHQVFQKSHPPREEAKYKTRRLDSAAETLTRLPFPVLEVHDRIGSLQYSTKHSQLLSTGFFRVHIGPAFDKYMEWGFIDDSVRFFTTDTKKLVGLFEHVHAGQLSCALFADSKTLVTAGNDCTVSIWTVISTPKAVDLQPRATLFGHRRSVNALTVSRSFSALLSASSDGDVILWDLNRLELTRVLARGKPVDCAKINDVTGTIILCRSTQLSIWTLNGELMLEQDLFTEGDDQILCCAFYEGSGSEYLERDLIFTGQRRGVVNVWNIAIRRGVFALEHVKSMHHLDQAGFNVGAAVTAILPMAHVVYTGDDDGRVYEWDCIQRQ